MEGMEVLLRCEPIITMEPGALTLDRIPVPKNASNGMIAMMPISPTVPSTLFSIHHNTIVKALTANTK
jgi:hypothetical protein